MTADASGRPSWAVRFVRHWFVRFVSMFVVLTVAYAGIQIAPSILMKQYPDLAHLIAGIGALVGGLLVLGIYALLVAWLEQRSASEIRLGAAPGGLLLGAIIGAVLFTAVIAILVAGGYGAVTLPAVITWPVLALAIGIASGVCEELIFRGAMFRIVEERFGTLIGLLVSAGFFGLIHLGNHAATAVSSAAIALEAGLLLALAYTATRTLWLPIGLHFAWNFTEGGIFSTAISGGKVPGILKTDLHGPDLITGGAFGPEASVVAVIVCMTAAAVFLAITIRRSEWRPFTLRPTRTPGP